MDQNPLALEAYYNLLVALAAQCDSILGNWDIEELLTDARTVLNISDALDVEYKEKADNDPVVLAVRSGQMPPPAGGRGIGMPAASLPPAPVQRPAAPVAPPMNYMPEPLPVPQQRAAKQAKQKAPPQMPVPIDPFSGSAFGYQPPQPAAKPPAPKKAKKESAAAAAHQLPAAASYGGAASKATAAAGAAASGYALIGKRVQRYNSEMPKPWVDAEIIEYNEASGQHHLRYTYGARSWTGWCDIQETINAGTTRWPDGAPGPRPDGGAAAANGGMVAGALAAQPAAPAGKSGGSRPSGGSKATQQRSSSAKAQAAANAGPPYTQGYLANALKKGQVSDLYTMTAALAAKGDTSFMEAISQLPPGHPEQDNINALVERHKALSKRGLELQQELYEYAS